MFRKLISLSGAAVVVCEHAKEVAYEIQDNVLLCTYLETSYRLPGVQSIIFIKQILLHVYSPSRSISGEGFVEPPSAIN